MNAKKLYNIAIVGATGLVGQEILKILDERCFPVKNIIPIASSKSQNSKINYKGSLLSVKTIQDTDPKNVDIIFNCISDDLAKKVYSHFCLSTNVIIDKSSYMRNRDELPLITNTVNLEKIDETFLLHNKEKSKIIPLPNCCVIPTAILLNAIAGISSIKRVVLSTYQSISGAGRAVLENFISDSSKSINLLENKDVRSLAFSVMPYIGRITKDISEEEEKIITELKKILSYNFDISVTCMRVPVLTGHTISINIEFNTKISLDKIKNSIENCNLCQIIEDSNIHNLSPVHAKSKNKILVGRIRIDRSNNILDLVISSDNLRIGAALHAIQIAEYLVEREFI